MSVSVNVDSNPQPAAPYKAYKFSESYWYDALGRRVATYVWHSTNCGSKDPDSGCKNYLTRTVWDGQQLLYELRWVFLSSDTVPKNFNPNFSPAVVGYTNGTALDRPLALFKASTVVVPHADWRGQLDQGSCPTAMCNADDPPFPGKFASAYGVTNPNGNLNWYGSLIGGMTDASGYLYRRNRYVDPKSGRFTQEDPIGLGGGLNLYGFAAGDPVTYSDPLGLCPPEKPICQWIKVGLIVAGTDLGGIAGGGAGMLGGPAALLTSPAGALAGIALGAGAGAAAGEWVDRAFFGSDGPKGTSHGEGRMGDASRLGRDETQSTIDNATARFTQRDGADVFVQRIGDRFNVVVRNADTQKIITNLKTIPEKAMNKLSDKYGWTP